MTYEQFVKKVKKPWIIHEIKYALVLDVRDEMLAILFKGELRIVGRPDHITEKMLGKWLSFWTTDDSYFDINDVKLSRTYPFPVKRNGRSIEAIVFVATRNLEVYPIGQQDVLSLNGDWLSEQRHPETLWSPEIHVVTDPSNYLREAEPGTVYRITVELSFSLEIYLQNENADPTNFFKREVKAVLQEAEGSDCSIFAETPWIRDYQNAAQHLWISPIHKQPTRTMLDKVKLGQTFIGLVHRVESDKIYIWSYDTLQVLVEGKDHLKLKVGMFVVFGLAQQKIFGFLPTTVVTRPHEQLYDVRIKTFDKTQARVEVAVSLLIPFDMEANMIIAHIFLGFMTINRKQLMDLCEEKGRKLREFRGRELKLWFRMIDEIYMHQLKTKTPNCWEIDSLHESMYS